MDKQNRTAIKIQNPPGGQSSFSIGGNYDNQPSIKQSAIRNNILSQAEEINPQKPSIRVGQTPGGNSTIQFGGYENNVVDPVHTSVKINRQIQSNIFGADEAPKPKSRQQHPQQTSNIFGEQDKPIQKQQKSNPNQSHNNIFGGDEAPRKQQQQQQQQYQKIGDQTQQDAQKTSVRVHNPPGGKSSFTFG